MMMSVSYHIADNEHANVGAHQLSGKTIAFSIGEVTFFCTKEQALVIGNELVRQSTNLSDPTAEEIAADNASTPF